MYSPDYMGKYASKNGDIKKKRTPLTPTRMNTELLFPAAESKNDDGPSFGAFGSLLMDAAKDAQEERDLVHAKRFVAHEKSAAIKKRKEEEEESKVSESWCLCPGELPR